MILLQELYEAAIEHTLEFADIAFGIPPFKTDLPQNWRNLGKEWMKGKNLSDFAGNVEREIVDFLEGALVYRLVWALESIRGEGDSGGRGFGRVIQRTNSARRRNRDTESIGIPSHSRRLRISGGGN